MAVRKFGEELGRGYGRMLAEAFDEGFTTAGIERGQAYR